MQDGTSPFLWFQQNIDPDDLLTSSFSTFLSVQFRIVSMDIDFIPVNRVVSAFRCRVCFHRLVLESGAMSSTRVNVSAEVYFGSGEWEGNGGAVC